MRPRLALFAIALVFTLVLFRLSRRWSTTPESATMAVDVAARQRPTSANRASQLAKRTRTLIMTLALVAIAIAFLSPLAYSSRRR